MSDMLNGTLGRWDVWRFKRKLCVNKILHYKARWIWKHYENFVLLHCQ